MAAKIKGGKAIGWCAAAVICATLAMAGCASLSPAKPEVVVGDRALSYWNAIIAGKWDEAYAYATPSYRAAVDPFGYRRTHDGFVKYNRAEVVAVSCPAADVCKVKVRLQVTIAVDMKMESVKVIEERWLRESGEWYRYIAR